MIDNYYAAIIAVPYSLVLQHDFDSVVNLFLEAPNESWKKGKMQGYLVSHGQVLNALLTFLHSI